MELLFGIYLGNLSSNVKFSHHFIDFLNLFLNSSEEWRAFERATDWSAPISAMFLQNFFIAIIDEFVIVDSFWDKEHEPVEKDVIFVNFFEI
mgnify:CR=1 FL=1